MNQTGMTSVLRYLPPPVQGALRNMPPDKLGQVQEVRIRAERPVGIAIHNTEQFLTPSGRCGTDAAQGIVISQRALENIFQALCEYSVYRYTREICEGFITIAGGNRVGIAGSAVYREGVLAQIRHISGLNFRISHAVTGCAKNLYGQTCGSRPCSILLAGAVGSGKTTMLRDLCRLLGSDHRVCLVDERSEIAAVHDGVPRYDVGIHTDVFDGFPRAEGLLTALRVMTPDVMICDEIGTEADAEAILRIHGCGVPIVATAHAVCWEDFEHRAVLRRLLQAGVFRYAAILRSDHQGEIQMLRRVEL